MKNFIKGNWFKLSIIFILLIVIFLIHSKTFQTENNMNENNDDNFFSKNEKCLSFKESLENRLINKGVDNKLGKYFLEQIFYSPKMNSCLYVEYFEMVGNESTYAEKHLLDMLNDGYSSTYIQMCEIFYEHKSFPSNKIKDTCVDFDKVIEQYKK